MNHKEEKILINGQLIGCKRGQSVRSLDAWAKDWNVSKGAVRDFFKLLQADSMINAENLKITTRITVCNYDSYQSGIHTEGTQREHRGNTNNNEDNDNKGSRPRIFLKTIPVDAR